MRIGSGRTLTRCSFVLLFFLCFSRLASFFLFSRPSHRCTRSFCSLSLAPSAPPSRRRFLAPRDHVLPWVLSMLARAAAVTLGHASRSRRQGQARRGGSRSRRRRGHSDGPAGTTGGGGGDRGRGPRGRSGGTHRRASCRHRHRYCRGSGGRCRGRRHCGATGPAMAAGGRGRVCVCVCVSISETRGDVKIKFGGRRGGSGDKSWVD